MNPCAPRGVSQIVAVVPAVEPHVADPAVGAPEEVLKLSPVDASARYLRAPQAGVGCTLLRRQPALALDRQERAFSRCRHRSTPRRASSRFAQRPSAGLAASRCSRSRRPPVYAWIASAATRWRRTLRVGDLLLVCDVGGGTTDFSPHPALGNGRRPRARARGDRRSHPARRRQHGPRRSRASCSSASRRKAIASTRGSCRRCGISAASAKETLFARARPGHASGHGARQGQPADRRHDAGGASPRRIWTRCSSTGSFRASRPTRCPHGAGTRASRSSGCPTRPIPAVTRHLARFLSGRRPAAPALRGRRGPSGLVCPTHLLFNGGVMKADPLRARIVDVLNGWLTREGFAPLDAGARARCAGSRSRRRARRGVLRAGTRERTRRAHPERRPRSYYIGIESALPAVPGCPPPIKALCVVPFGMEEGTSAPIAGHASSASSSASRPTSAFSASTIRQGRPAGTTHRGLGRRARRARPARGHAHGRPLLHGSDAVVPVTLESRGHRDRHAQSVVQERDGIDAGSSS